jgi:hypothetical protein
MHLLTQSCPSEGRCLQAAMRISKVEYMAVGYLKRRRIRGTELDEKGCGLGVERSPIRGCAPEGLGRRRERRATISSTADAPSATRSGTRATASSIVGTGIHATLVTLGAGTVSIVASATKASVPSDPTMSRRKISSGVAASRSAQSR